MSVTVTERLTSRRTRQNRRAERIYTIRGTSDQDAALAALAVEAPSLIGTLERKPLEVEPFETEDMWIGRAIYVRPDEDEPETGDFEQGFEFGTRSEHITQSLATCASGYNSDLTDAASDYGGAINVTQDDVKGVDIDFSYQVEEAVVYVAEADLPGPDELGLPGDFTGGSMDAYKRVCSGIVGRVNDAAWMDCDAGEAKMLSITGRKRAAGDWQLRFRWGVARNRETVTIGESPDRPDGLFTITNEDTGVAKYGWDYLWVRYADDVDDAAKSFVQIPKEAYVEQVYEFVDFSPLQLEEWKAAAE